MTDYQKGVDYYTTKGSRTYTTTKPVSEYGVPLKDYTSVGSLIANPRDGSIDQVKHNVYTIDSDAYRKAQLDWMNGNAAFAGWSDADKVSFLDSVNSNGYGPSEANAAQIYQNYQIGVNESNERRAKDRADMLAEIEAYKAGFSNESIAAAVALERQSLDSKIQATLDDAVNRAASQGRIIDNTTYAMMRGRLEAQAANVLQQTQMQYEEKRQEYMFNAMKMKNDVYSNSQDTMMSPDELTNLIKSMAGSR